MAGTLIISSIFILLLRIEFGVSKNDIESKCEICKDMVSSFEKKMTKTASHGFGGGNTDWEESRLGKYSKSESRLLEILDEICEKVSKESICHAMVEKYETEIYDWWFKKTSEQPKLEKYLCIDNSKVCCPENTYGKDCKDCPGGKDKPCNGHGTCRGAGTRSNSGGSCNCDNGYTGDNCDSCTDGFVDAGNSTCNECDKSCKSTCSEEGPKGCDDCKDGWIADEDAGCIDIDECKGKEKEEENEPVCNESEFCVNNVGSYECKGCHESCKLNCSGEGSNSCFECKDGYIKNENSECGDIDECSSTAQCMDGTYCLNTLGSYQCEACHESCESECTGPGASSCKACSQGYKMVDGECKDIDECSEGGDSNPCTDPSKYCKNTQGSYECADCDVSCVSCLAPGPTGCIKCKEGFTMTEAGCRDETIKKNDEEEEEDDKHDEF